MPLIDFKCQTCDYQNADRSQSTGCLWLRGTSLVGFGAFADPERSSGVRTLWLLAAIAGIALSLQGCISIINTYLDYGTSTSISQDVFVSLPYPTVTICPLNLYSYAKVNASSEFRYLLQRNVFSGNTSELNLNASARAALAPNWRQQIIAAYFDGSPVFVSEFQPIDLGPVYGLCQQFNIDSSRISGDLGGSNSGLVMYLNTMLDDYMPYIETAGFLLAVHAADEIPNMLQNGILAGPGTSTRAAITQRTQISPGQPYVECATDEEIAKTQKSRLQYLLDQQTCFENCQVSGILGSCGCVPGSLLALYPELPVCYTETQSDCVDNFGRNFLEIHGAELLRRCNCPLFPCNRVTYDVTTSSAQWPTPAVAESIAIGFAQQNLSIEGNITADYVRTNGARLAVFFKSLIVTVVEQSPATTLSDTVANIGGTVGLFLGASALVVIEFMELLFLLIPRRWRYAVWLHRTAFEPPPDKTGWNKKRDTLESFRRNEDSSTIQLSDMNSQRISTASEA